MPLVQVLLSDTFDQWRQKVNSLIGQVNSLAQTGDILSIANPLAAQVLVFDGTAFRNVPITGDVALDENGAMSIVGGVRGAVTKGRMLFSGATRSLY